MKDISVYETLIRDLRKVDDRTLLMIRSMLTTYINTSNEEDTYGLYNYDIKGRLLDIDEMVDAMDRSVERFDEGKEKGILVEEMIARTDKKFEILERTGKWPDNPMPAHGTFEVLNSFAVVAREECYLLGRCNSGKIMPGATVYVPANSSLAFDFTVSRVEEIEVNEYPDVDLLLTIATDGYGEIGTLREFLMALNVHSEILEFTNSEDQVTSL